jgi:2,4-dienoyl-CoA reductase-like NADH-dependent reductase (Old Yellow Enzyme family)
VALNLGSGYIARIATWVMFGTPREMTCTEITEAIQQFINGAKQAHLAGFKGVELHGAHRYLIAQFLSPKTNLRTDEFGGTPAKRAEIVLRIIKGIRAVTDRQFCVGIKMNSVDVSDHGNGGLEACLEQMGLIIDAGVDFIEISGGSYEKPSMFQVDLTAPAIGVTTAPPTGVRTPKASTMAREAFFLDFEIPLMVTGGFRSRKGMEAALESGACDIIGIGRPAAVVPKLPKTILLNKEVTDAEANFRLKRVKMGWLMGKVPIKALGAGAEGTYYGKQIRRMGKGLQPIDTRV